MFKRVFKVVAINLALLLVLVAAAELLFGTWFSDDPLDQLWLPRDSKVLVSAKALYQDADGEFVYRRDKWGLRGDHADPSRITILTIGGSTTNQLYLPEESTWQQVLERQFHDNGRSDVVVANAGVDGQSTVGHLQALRDWFPHVPGLKPRFVLAYVGVNDTRGVDYWTESLRNHAFHRIVKQKSAIFRLSRLVSGMIVAKRAKLTHRALDRGAIKWTETGAQVLPASDSNIEHYKQRLKLMADEIHAMGAVPVFVTQPRGDYKISGGKLLGMVTDNGPNGIDQYNALAPYNAATRQVCRENGLLCLDLAKELTFADGDFYDYLHNTPQGAEKIGRWLYSKLAGLV
ncbi:MAG: GDSL-type esterase/lipase family protein [Magnetospirillum sp.]|nr:GDSL-type esterase/lipase family protein [Magnetospirillum sp.]